MPDFTDQVTKPSPPPFAGRSTDSEFSATVVSGPDAGKVFALDGSRPPRVYIGHASSCELVLGDPRVSRRHAALDLCGTHLVLTDSGSRNGTYVNGVLVMQARLAGGEVLKVGDTTLRIDLVDAARSVPAVASDRFGRLIGASVEMRRLYAVLDRLARSSSPVLVEGEAGTGKDIVAEALHERGPHAQGPFLVIDVAETADVDASVFGPNGAFTQLQGGTIVLGEIGALSYKAQSALIAGIKRAASDAPRVIATTEKDLDREVHAGRFREDVLQLFDDGRIELPPLRRRDGDVRYLALHLWEKLGGTPDEFPFDLLEHLAAYRWPGNVTELETKLAQRLAGQKAESSAPAIAAPPVRGDVIEQTLAQDLPLVRAREEVVKEFERRYLERALTKQNGNVLRAAAASGVARRYFQILRAKRLR